ncbi:heme exporter protein CcmB [Halorhodospira neutriphila]|uniref:Heme exporter protein B n=1 Tax=Halorhodospira neutriphila TaxID=168379 RepID=A0ABS1E3D8_9GAMM|nr:heme exporter protein CcmB [Halorhodospira neutriphila]MBK1726270.1 heme exporter protein CcmB [Halorhodospira neutriphila]
MLRSLWTLMRRDLSLIVTRRQDVLTVVAFFILVITLFPLALGPDPQKLRTLAPAGVWVAAALASLISLDRLFADDWRDGSLEQLLLAPEPLTVVALAKVAAHWLALGLPLVVLSPALGYALGLEGAELGVLAVSLLLGTPVLSLLGAVGAALTLGVRAGGALMALLILPLYVPVLVLGAGAVTEAMYSSAFYAHLSLLGALLAAALPLLPLAIAGALRIALD